MVGGLEKAGGVAEESGGARDALQRAFEDGLSQGRLEAQAQAAEKAKAYAEKVDRQIVEQVEVRTERITHDIAERSKAAYAARLQLIEHLMASLPVQIDAMLTAAEDDMLALCFDVLCRMIGEKAASAEHIRAYVQIAAQALRNQKLVSVHLHPDDLETLRRDGAAAEMLGTGDVSWVADESIDVGGCIVRSAEGGIDARFETQLEALRTVLKAHRAAGHQQEASV